VARPPRGRSLPFGSSECHQVMPYPTLAEFDRFPGRAAPRKRNRSRCVGQTRRSHGMERNSGSQLRGCDKQGARFFARRTGRAANQRASAPAGALRGNKTRLNRTRCRPLRRTERTEPGADAPRLFHAAAHAAWKWNRLTGRRELHAKAGKPSAHALRSKTPHSITFCIVLGNCSASGRYNV
jgi:hypothetical protein